MQNKSPLSTLIQSQAQVYGKRAAMLYRDDEVGRWKEISWLAFSRKVRIVSNALLELGVGVQENIAVFSQNMPECMYPLVIPDLFRNLTLSRHAGLDPASPSIITNNYTKTYMCNKSKSNSFNNDNLVKQVTYLIGNEIAQGNHTPITPEFVAASLHVSLPEATDALKSAIGVISGK